MTTTLASPAPAQWTPPMLKPHQQPVHDFLVANPYAGVWLGMGGGKTLVTLLALNTTRPAGHILVIAPANIARSTWLDEIESWGLPLRTRSLIYDEQDRKLTRAQRLERFAQIPTDPPSLYLINHDLITQPSKPITYLKTTRPPTANELSALDGVAASLVADLTARGGSAVKEPFLAEFLAAHDGLSKAALGRAVKKLRDLDLVVTAKDPCAACAGVGCRECTFGLIDQLPRRIDPAGNTVVHWPFPTVIIDESQAFKSHSSNRFQALAAMRPAISRLIELSGTPAPNGLHDLWSQVYLLDMGQALGANITAYRQRWFTAKTQNNIPIRWEENPGAEAEIHQAINHLVISSVNADLKLPELSIDDVHIRLPVDLMEAYSEFKTNLVLEVVTGAVPENWMDLAPEDPQMMATVAQVVAANAAVLNAKLLQFANGTLYTSDPDEPETATGEDDYVLLHPHKLEMLEYLVRNNNHSPVLLAHHFRSDRIEIVKHLKAAGHNVQVFDGSRQMIRAWNAGQIGVLVIHPASAGHGLNLQHGGHTLIWYGLTHNLEHYLQANARLHRPGQTKPVQIYRLLAKGTIDDRMPSVLAAKQGMQDRLLLSADRAATPGGVWPEGSDPMLAATLSELSAALPWSSEFP